MGLRIKIVGGFSPSTNIAAQAGALDTTREERQATDQRLSRAVAASFVRPHDSSVKGAGAEKCESAITFRR